MKQIAVYLGLLLIVGCAPQDEPTGRREAGTEEQPGEDRLEATQAPSETQPNPFMAATNPAPSFGDEDYGSISNYRQTVDIYLPAEGEGPFPAVLAFHGGGFRARSKTLYAPYASYFTDRGFALISANYRLLPDAYPLQVEDAFCALAWIGANAAEHGLDPDRVIVMGDSSGGYLAAMVGTVDTPELYQGDCPHEISTTAPPRGIIVLYGFFDLTNLDAFIIPGGIATFMGGTVDDLPQARLAEMSPLSWIDGTEPPFLLIHGTEDRYTKSSASEEFSLALEEAGVESTLFLVEEDHAFFLDRSSPGVAASLDVMDEFLGNVVEP